MLDQLKLLVRAGNPLIAIETQDEESATEFVRQAAVDLGLPLSEWSTTGGLVRTRPQPQDLGIAGGKPNLALEHALRDGLTRQLYLFKDLGPHCREPFVIRQLRDLQCTPNSTLVLLDNTPLPDAVRRLTTPLELKLPTAAELEQLVRGTFQQIKLQSFAEVSAKLTRREMDHLVQTLRGLTKSEAVRVVTAAILDDYSLAADDLPRIVEAKRSRLQAAGCLESIIASADASQMGGLENLKRWLARRRGGMSARAAEFGLEPPRGLLLLGVQGCGKSLCAKVVAAEWNLPLMRMDPGVLYQKFIGESENRLRAALAQAEAMAPVVLWIDEIEKAFASAGAESADGGLSQRMFGTLLSWMQDHRSPIFLVATANNIAALPPELMRKGRFDEIFFVDLPARDVRRDILAIHLLRRKRDPQAFPLDDLAMATDGFSGAELEQLVISALYAAFADNTELTPEHLFAEASATRPLSVLMGEQIRDLRSWAADRCVPADG